MAIFSINSILSFNRCKFREICSYKYIRSDQLLSRVWLFATPWITAHQAACPSPTLRVHSDSRPSSQWCHPAISSSVAPFSSCPQSLPASGSFPMSQFFASGGHSIGGSASASDQIRLVAQSCLTLCDLMYRSTPGISVHHQLPEFTQTHVHRVSDAIQPSHPLSSPSPPSHNLSQHQSLFQWVNSSHEVAKVLEFQL